MRANQQNVRLSFFGLAFVHWRRNKAVLQTIGIFETLPEISTTSSKPLLGPQESKAFIFKAIK